MSDEAPTPPDATVSVAPLPAPLVQWMAVQALQDRYARLVEGGADSDTRIELATLFVDLPVRAPSRRALLEDPETGAMRWLLGEVPSNGDLSDAECLPKGRRLRWLLVGGPGSGKSTLTTMVAQVLRLSWVERQADALPDNLRDVWKRMREGLARVAAEVKAPPPSGRLPLRVNLPAFARWLWERDRSVLSLWDYLAWRMVNDLALNGIQVEVSGSELRAMTAAVREIVWILDGLDEVPPSAGRQQVIATVRATLGGEPDRAGELIVATRPQGYEGEFDDLDALGLLPLPPEVAHAHAERLLRAWSARGASSELVERLEAMRVEFAKPEVEALLQTPLHTTMAALLVANNGKLPNARSRLFERYFETIFKRELGKPFDHGIQEEEEGILRTLHARAGLALHVRSQERTGARSSLRRRELRGLLAAIYRERKFGKDDVRTNVERIMRFSTERLVLLMHAAEGEYEFSVRSLQEFFASQALVEGDAAVVRGRLDAVALDAHWANVQAFVVSNSALARDQPGRDRALLFTVALCRALNAGEVGGETAARCFMGSRFAIAMLRETERYGEPWLHDPLWEIALAAADSPSQQTSAWVAEESNRRPLSGAWGDTLEIHAHLGLLAAKWSGTRAELRRQQVLGAAEVHMKQDGEARLNGWRLLGGMLRNELPDAIRVADACAPATREVAREVFEVLAEGNANEAPRWLESFMEKHPEWFTPGGAWVRFRLSHDLASVILSELLQGARLTGLHAQPFRMNHLSSFAERTAVWQELAARAPEVTPEWVMWKRVALFLAVPSHVLLADVLDGATNTRAFLELQRRANLLPWPIQACVEFVRTRDELSLLAQQLRDGQLGTADDWTAAEARWSASPVVTVDELDAWLCTPGPWQPGIASRGVVLTSDLRHPYGDGPWVQTLSEQLLQWIDSHPVPPRKALRLLGYLLHQCGGLPLPIARLADRDADDVQLRPLRSLPQLLPDLSGPDAEGWFELLDARGRAGRNVANFFVRGRDQAERAKGISQAIIRRLRDRPDQWGLVDALWCMVQALPDTDLSALKLPNLPTSAPLRAQATHAVLALLSGHFEPSDRPARLARLHFVEDDDPIDLRLTLAWVLRQREHDSSGVIDLLGTVLDAQPAPLHDVRDALLGALFAQLRRSATPAFVTQEAWQAHGLPEPFLSGQPSQRLPPRVVRLAELANLRIFKETPVIDVPFAQPDRERGQWVVLVGENGIGKTTLLRALALALASPDVASKLLDERLAMVRNGGDGRVSVELDTGTLTIAVRRGERTEVVESTTPDGLRPWVVGYGVRRGNARGEKDREPEVGALGELHTLFDRPASLHGAVQWLANLDADVLREQRRSPRQGTDVPAGPRESVWRAVEYALQVLLEVTKVEVDEGGIVYVRHPRFDRVRLDALSDGYLTTAGWVIDMIARWIDRQRELDEPVGADLLRQMCGFVLLDEIDLHLHPLWQMRIVDDVRRLFPRLSFVVTTHNPLTLYGARSGEVYVMRRESERGDRIELVQKDIRPGYDVDRVLLEQFGVEHTFDRETRELLLKHRKLVVEGAAVDDPKRVDMERRLRERLGHFGGVVQEQRRGPADARPSLSEAQREGLDRWFTKKPGNA